MGITRMNRPVLCGKQGIYQSQISYRLGIHNREMSDENAINVLNPFPYRGVPGPEPEH